MSTKSQLSIVKKACTRCSSQKRRCDKASPNCGLCTRLGQRCKYEPLRAAISVPTPSPSPRPETSIAPQWCTPVHLRDAILYRLGSFTPEDALSAYCRAIEPWFPVISTSRLHNPSTTWEEVDVPLLCLLILLVTTPPSSAENENDFCDFRSLYLFCKSCVTSTEGLGVNSFLVVQSRILLTLFEVAHGFYPAAYISIGASVRALDALQDHPPADVAASHPLDHEARRREDTVLTWCGVLVLDRYITIESGSKPSLTRPRTQYLLDLLKPTLCPTHQHDQDPTSPICQLSRLVEGSSLVDRIHNTLHGPSGDDMFNFEELILTVSAAINLQTILNREISNGIALYSSGLALCQTTLVLAFENGSKVPCDGGSNDDCNRMATASLLPLLAAVTSTGEPFTLRTDLIDFNLLPPFAAFLVYKVAAIVTNRLMTKSDGNDGLNQLRVLRDFLRIGGERWLGFGRYLKLLDEDTTPRILKAL